MQAEASRAIWTLPSSSALSRTNPKATRSASATSGLNENYGRELLECTPSASTVATRSDGTEVAKVFTLDHR